MTFHKIRFTKLGSQNQVSIDMTKITRNNLTTLITYNDWEKLVEQAINDQRPIEPFSFHKQDGDISHQIEILRSIGFADREQKATILNHSLISYVYPNCSEGLILLFELTVLTRLQIEQIEHVLDFSKKHPFALDEFETIKDELSTKMKVLQKLGFIAHEVFSLFRGGDIGLIALQTFHPSVNVYSEIINGLVGGNFGDETLLAYDRLCNTKNASGKKPTPEESYRICKEHHFDSVSIELAIMAWEYSGKLLVPQNVSYRFRYESSAFLSFEQAREFVFQLYQKLKPQEKKLDARYSFGNFEQELKKHFDFVIKIAQSDSAFFTEKGFSLKEWEEQYPDYIKKLYQKTLSVRLEYREHILHREIQARKLWGLVKNSERITLQQAYCLIDQFQSDLGSDGLSSKINQEALLLQIDDAFKVGREVSARILLSIVSELHHPSKNDPNILEQIRNAVGKCITDYEQGQISSEKLVQAIQKANAIISEQPEFLERYSSLFA